MSKPKADEKLKTLKSNLYKAVTSTEDVQKLRQGFEVCTRQDMLSWTDDAGYDMLHHAILSNNIEAVGIIFARGLFKPPHEPTRPYIHAAANMGNKAIVAMLLQERPRDNKVTEFKWITPPKHGPMTAEGGVCRLTPLDVAGNSGHVGCVTTILDFYSGNNPVRSEADNHLCRACVNNSPSALRLLFSTNPSEEDVKAAVGAALKHANAECLDVLLMCNARLTSLFRGMNLYHVLFSYSLSFKKEWYESLLTVTSVLLKHRQNPMCAVPFRTYPLYSLLSHVPASDFGKSSPYIVACVVLLLNAGVDPNFNEIKFETDNESHNIQSAFGRPSYASAFHCLLDTIASFAKHFEDDNVYIRRHVSKCTETLLNHDADPNICGPVGEDGLLGNALHAFMTVPLYISMNVRSVTTYKLLLQNGADPNANPSGKYPFNVLFDECLRQTQTLEKMHKTDEAAFVEVVKEVGFTLLDNMTHVAVREAYSVGFDGKPIHSLQKKVFKMLKDELYRRANVVWSLKAACRIQIMQLCGRRCSTVATLTLPKLLKDYITDIAC